MGETVMMQRATNLVFLILVLVTLLGSVSLVFLGFSERVAEDRGREAIADSEETN